MEKLARTGRIFFGLLIVGMGIQQFIYPGFRPVIIPEWPVWLPGMTALVFITGAAMIFAGAAIIFNWKGRVIALFTGIIFLLLLVFFHLPHRVNNNPGMLAAWTIDFKLLGKAGGCFLAALTFPKDAHNDSVVIRLLERIAKWGHVFFAIMLIVFGIDHFLYVDGVKSLVPAWIPWKEFWTYFTGIALMGSGIAFILRIKMKLIGILCGVMILVWTLILHFPRTLHPQTDNGNELTSLFQALGFAGIAFMISTISRKGAKT